VYLCDLCVSVVKGFETISPEGEREQRVYEIKLNLMALPLPLPARERAEWGFVALLNVSGIN
jgi:hypothetical protein